MFRLPRACFSTCCGALTVAWACVLPCRAETDMPRYRFAFGQAFVYETKRDGTAEGTIAERLHVWVVEARDTGGWRLLLRKEPFTDGAVDASRVTLAYLDIEPDGSVAANPTISLLMPPRNYFPKLPGTPAELVTGWKEYDPVLDLASSYLSLPDADGSACTVTGSMVEGGSTTRRYGWDAALGTVAKISFFTGRETILASSSTLASAAAVALGRDAVAYFQAVGDHSRRLDAAIRMPNAEATRESLAAGRRAFGEVVQTIQSPEVATVAQATLAGLEAEAEAVCKPGGIRERTSRVLGKPLGDWEATDLDGRRHAAEDYRGKIVVADFWFRSCPYCILAMPQVKAVAARFRGRPVEVLGMNVDENVDDARFMVDSVGMPWPTLQAKSLEGLFHVRDFGCPSIFVIDGAGVVRSVRVGYSATLCEDLGAEVEALLTVQP